MPKYYEHYSSPPISKKPLGPGALALFAVLVMFCLLPFTQFLSGMKKPTVKVRHFEVAPPPPQSPPPEPPPPQEEPPVEVAPEMEAPPPQLSLSQLSMAINPGVGSALVGDFSLGNIGVSADETMAQISLFEISDLDEPPHTIKKPPINFPAKFRRDKKEGLIRMTGIINSDGTVEIRNVEQAIDRDYEEFFRHYFESLLYSKPTVGGKPVSAKIVFNVPVEWR